MYKWNETKMITNKNLFSCYIVAVPFDIKKKQITAQHLYEINLG